MQAARVLRARNDAVTDADDDGLEELSRGKSGRGGGDDECENRFFMRISFDAEVDAVVAARTDNGGNAAFYSFSDFGKAPVYLKGRRLVSTAVGNSERARATS